MNAHWAEVVAKYGNRNHVMEFFAPVAHGLGMEYWSLDGEPEDNNTVIPILETATPKTIIDYFLATKRYARGKASASPKDLSNALARRNRLRIKSERARSR